MKRAETHNNCSDQLIWKRTMGSGLGLICDKTHRVLSSLVGIRSKYLLKIKSQQPINIVWLFENHNSLLCWRLTRGNALLASGGPSTGEYFKGIQGVYVGYLPNTKFCFCDQLHIFGFDHYLMKVVPAKLFCQLTSPWSSLGWLTPGTLTWIASVNFIGARFFIYFANTV